MTVMVAMAMMAKDYDGCDDGDGCDGHEMFAMMVMK